MSVRATATSLNELTKADRTSSAKLSGIGTPLPTLAQPSIRYVSAATAIAPSSASPVKAGSRLGLILGPVPPISTTGEARKLIAPAPPISLPNKIAEAGASFYYYGCIFECNFSFLLSICIFE